VEDDRAKLMLREILVSSSPDMVGRVQIISFGASGVGVSLGQMVKQRRFPRPSLVFLDGDQAPAEGCHILPGEDAPERVVFEALKLTRWGLLPMRTGREYSEIEDACARAMTSGDHHEWVMTAAKELLLGGDTLWQMMCSEWASNCLSKDDGKRISDSIRAAFPAVA